MRILTLCLFMLLLPFGAAARPVSYAGGWTVMQMNDRSSNSLHVHYSPTAKYSIGYKAEYWREEDWQFHGAQLNYLAKRWNNPASQANLYVKSGAGIGVGDDEDTGDTITSPAGFIGLAADWEDRRWFTSYENRAVYAQDIDSSVMHKARLGVAPYIGDYGDLHTWLMLEAEYAPGDDEAFELTPLVRLFQGDVMAEAGVSTRGNVLLNLNLRF